MASRFFSDAELEALRGFPEISRDELIRFFDLEPSDLAFARSFRSPRSCLGVAVQLASLGWLGFVPDDLSGCPSVAVERLARQLGVSAELFVGLWRRDQTRMGHLRQVIEFLGWRTAGGIEAKELDQFLLARAMEDDAPSVLFRLACDYSKGAKVVRPGPVVLVEHVAAAREAAKLETFAKVEHLLTRERCADLDRLCGTDAALGVTRLHWLHHGATVATPVTVRAEIDKLIYVRSLGGDRLDLSMVPMERRRFLAGIGRRSTGRTLARRDPERRYPILLTLLAQTAVDVRDEVVSLFDQTLSGRESKARYRLEEQLAERARTVESRIELLNEILVVAANPEVADEDVGPRLRTGIGMDRLQAAHAARAAPLPRDHGHLALIDASFSYLRGFAPHVLAAVEFVGGTEAAELIEAVGVLRELYATGARLVPPDAPVGFVPAR